MRPLRDAREPLCFSCFHFRFAFLHCLFKSLRSSFNHGHEEGVFFLNLTGAIGSRMVVQELLKSLTNSSTERGVVEGCREHHALRKKHGRKSKQRVR